MHLDVRGRDEDGNVLFEGKLNPREISYLLQHAINDLLMAGAQFYLQEPDNEEEPPNRIRFPNAH